MKTLLKIYVWVMYIIALPVFLVFSITMLLWNSIENYRDCGEWEFKEFTKEYCEGIVIGHNINMERIEDIFSDDEGYHEEGV